jgi:hypothetical protein
MTTGPAQSPPQSPNQSPTCFPSHLEDALRHTAAQIEGIQHAVDDACDEVNTRIPAEIRTIRGKFEKFQDKFAHEADATKEHTREIKSKVETMSMKIDNLRTSLTSEVKGLSSDIKGLRRETRLMMAVVVAILIAAQFFRPDFERLQQTRQ